MTEALHIVISNGLCLGKKASAGFHHKPTCIYYTASMSGSQGDSVKGSGLSYGYTKMSWVLLRALYQPCYLE